MEVGARIISSLFVVVGMMTKIKEVEKIGDEDGDGDEEDCYWPDEDIVVIVGIPTSSKAAVTLLEKRVGGREES